MIACAPFSLIPTRMMADSISIPLTKGDLRTTFHQTSVFLSRLDEVYKVTNHDFKNLKRCMGITNPFLPVEVLERYVEIYQEGEENYEDKYIHGILCRHFFMHRSNDNVVYPLNSDVSKIPYKKMKSEAIFLLKRLIHCSELPNGTFSKAFFIPKEVAKDMKINLKSNRDRDIVRFEFDDVLNSMTFSQHYKYSLSNIDSSTDDDVLVTIRTLPEDTMEIKCMCVEDASLPGSYKSLVSWRECTQQYGGDAIVEFTTKTMHPSQVKVLKELMDRFFYPQRGTFEERFCFSSIYGNQTIEVGFVYPIKSNVTILKMATGSGKTLVACGFIENMAVLDPDMTFTVVCPRKIIPQWKNEMREICVDKSKVNVIAHTTHCEIDTDVLIIDEFTDKKILSLTFPKFKYCILISATPEPYLERVNTLMFGRTNGISEIVRGMVPTNMFFAESDFRPDIRIKKFVKFITLSSIEIARICNMMHDNLTPNQIMKLFLDSFIFSDRERSDFGSDEQYSFYCRQVEMLRHDRESENCVICLDHHDDTSRVYSCGHVFHTTCLTTTKCPLCRAQNIFPIDFSTDKTYGSKLDEVLKLLKTVDGHTALFVNDIRASDRLCKVLRKEFPTITIKNLSRNCVKRLEDVNTNPNRMFVVMNQTSGLSGVNLPNFKNAIFVSPLHGTDDRSQAAYIQAIGRLTRLNQSYEEINVFHLIVQDTFEEAIYHNKFDSMKWALKDGFYNTKTVVQDFRRQWNWNNDSSEYDRMMSRKRRFVEIE